MLLGLEPIAGVDYTGLLWDAPPGTAAAGMVFSPPMTAGLHPKNHAP
jgi:hypothetical protein